MVKEVIHWFKSEIYSNNLKPGDKLQSRRFYEIKFGISKKTIEKVFLFLEQNNFIFSVEKKGYFVKKIEEQTWWKSEKAMGKFEVKIFKEDISHCFPFKEIQSVFEGFLKNKIYQHNYYSYKKIYFKEEKISKISFTWNNKILKFKQDEIQKSFYYYLWKNNIHDSSRIEVIKGNVTFCNTLKKLMQKSYHEGVGIFILIQDDQQIPIHVTKQFIVKEQINLKYFFHFF